MGLQRAPSRRGPRRGGARRRPSGARRRSAAARSRPPAHRRRWRSATTGRRTITQPLISENGEVWRPQSFDRWSIAASESSVSRWDPSRWLPCGALRSTGTRRAVGTGRTSSPSGVPIARSGAVARIPSVMSPAHEQQAQHGRAVALGRQERHRRRVLRHDQHPELVRSAPQRTGGVSPRTSGACVQRPVDGTTEHQRPDGMQVVLESRRDPEVAAAAAQDPEELRLVIGVDPVPLAAGGDQLDRAQVVDGESVGGASDGRTRRRGSNPAMPTWPTVPPGNSERMSLGRLLVELGPEQGRRPRGPRGAPDPQPTSSARGRSSPPSSQTEYPVTECPPPRTETGSSWRGRAKRTACWTSSVPAQRAISAGRRSTAPFQTARVSAYPSSPGCSNAPRKRGRRDSDVSDQARSSRLGASVAGQPFREPFPALEAGACRRSISAVHGCAAVARAQRALAGVQPPASASPARAHASTRIRASSPCSPGAPPPGGSAAATTRRTRSTSAAKASSRSLASASAGRSAGPAGKCGARISVCSRTRASSPRVERHQRRPEVHDRARVKRGRARRRARPPRRARAPPPRVRRAATACARAASGTSTRCPARNGAGAARVARAGNARSRPRGGSRAALQLAAPVRGDLRAPIRPRPRARRRRGRAALRARPPGGAHGNEPAAYVSAATRRSSARAAARGSMPSRSATASARAWTWLQLLRSDSRPARSTAPGSAVRSSSSRGGVVVGQCPARARARAPRPHGRSGAGRRRQRARTRRIASSARSGRLVLGGQHAGVGGRPPAQCPRHAQVVLAPLRRGRARAYATSRMRPWLKS